MKGTKIADNYLNSDSRDFWKEAEKLRGRKKLPISAVGGLTDSDDIADAFSAIIRHYITLLILTMTTCVHSICEQ